MVANVSRTVVEAMRRTYADVVVVSVTAPPEVLARTPGRAGRGSDGKYRDRLARVVDDAAAAPDVTISQYRQRRTATRRELRAGS